MTDKFTIPESESLTGKEVGNLWSRRKFLGFISWGAFIGAIQIGLLAFVRFMYPRVLFEPSPIFVAGKPSDYQIDDVNEKYKDSHRVWIVRNKEGIYALLAICTHLGCTPRWLKSEVKFKCPCHGSGFRKNGMNFEGPAPRPLERLKIGLNEEGKIIIDRSKKFVARDQWENNDALLRV